MAKSAKKVPHGPTIKQRAEAKRYRWEKTTYKTDVKLKRS